MHTDDEQGVDNTEDVAELLIEASRRLLKKGGWQALSINAICREAGVYRTAVSYHYGSKDGLIAALIEDIIHDAATRVAGTIGGYPLSDQRVMETLARFQRLGGPETQIAFFDAFPHLFRDPTYRPQVAHLYRDAATISALALGAEDEATRKAMLPVARALLAFVDGLFIQQLADPDEDFGPTVQLFASMLKPVVAGLLGYAASSE